MIEPSMPLRRQSGSPDSRCQSWSMEGVIMAGHTRYEVAKKLGMAEVPAIVATDLMPNRSLRTASPTTRLRNWPSTNPSRLISFFDKLLSATDVYHDAQPTRAGHSGSTA